MNKKYKYFIAIIFGLIGFIVNFHAPNIMTLTEEGIKVNFLWGLIFPFIISIAWGPKFGLISALVGGCQSMWWLWGGSHGYGVFFSVPIYTLWVVWHGYWTKYRKKYNKLYYNKYIVELVFRILGAVGIYTIFNYLVSLNPPPWAPNLSREVVSFSWMNKVILKHTFTGFLLLVTVNVLLNINFIRKIFRIKHKKEDQITSFLYYVFVLLGFIFWIGDALLSYIYEYNYSFFELLLFNIPSQDLLIRLIVFVFCLIMGNLTSSFVSRKKTAEKKYKTLFNNLEDAVILCDYQKDKNSFLEVNNEFENMLKYNKEELKNLSLNDISEVDIKKNLYDNPNKSSFKSVTKLTTKDNKQIPVEIKARSFKMKNKDVILAIARDITERKNYEEELEEQRNQLQSNYQKLTAFSEEVVAINKELEEVVEKNNELNNRLIKMIDVVTDLPNKSKSNKEQFLSKMLQSAIEIVPEADSGTICTCGNNKCQFIEAFGHNLNLLNNLNFKKQTMCKMNIDKDVYVSNKYFCNKEKMSKENKRILDKALQPFSKTIFMNITFESEIVGRISLDISHENEQSFSETSKRILRSFSSIVSTFFYFHRYYSLHDQFTKELVVSITQVLEMYDKYTSGHSENVAELSMKIAQELELSNEKINDAYWAGMVHDIGKLLIPKDILSKKGKLTDKEYKQIKKHPKLGYDVLKKSETMGNIAEYVYYHHERWDGKGYPEGLSGEEIPKVAQILTVADVWDAMRSARPYRDSLAKEKAIKEIKDNLGTQFSPKIAKVLLRLIREERVA